MSGWRSVEFGWRSRWHRNENKSRCVASRAGNEPRRCSETQPPLSQREPEAWAHSAPNRSPIWTHLFAFFVAVAKTNVKTFLPSFWVMSIRLIWSAKICDLSDSNSEWAAPRHLPTHEPPCAHRQPHVLCVAQQMLPMWGITWISYVPNSYALTSSHFFIDSRYQSVILFYWELYVRWLSISVCQIHDYYLQNSVLLFVRVFPLVLAPKRCLLHIHIDISMVQLVSLKLFIITKRYYIA